MQLSTKGRYAVRAMFDLAFYSQGEPVPLSRISEREEISLHYLEQLFNKLRKGGVVESVRGPSGGFKLARKPSEISVEEIISIVEGPIVPVSCLEHKDKDRVCHRAEKCVTFILWKRLGKNITEFLSSVTLQDLVDEARELLDSGKVTHDYMFYI
ncbi:MAG: Rrf2 family transcriptional regulator [Nitrospirae bacterium]|nr:Rrf2 family transcriptional regulator [Nitrospirota bacterium]MBI5694151.1 Rrf2 family transcriptional regulator [Nitrospirota bacterium]